MKSMTSHIVAVTLMMFSHPPAAGPGVGSKKWEEVVRIEFVKKEHVYTMAEVAKGIKIDYQIIVEQNFPGVIPLPPTPGYAKPSGPSGLWPLEKIAGNGQQ